MRHLPESAAKSSKRRFSRATAHVELNAEAWRFARESIWPPRQHAHAGTRVPISTCAAISCVAGSASAPAFAHPNETGILHVARRWTREPVVRCRPQSHRLIIEGIHDASVLCDICPPPVDGKLRMPCGSARSFEDEPMQRPTRIDCRDENPHLLRPLVKIVESLAVASRRSGSHADGVGPARLVARGARIVHAVVVGSWRAVGCKHAHMRRIRALGVLIAPPTIADLNDVAQAAFWLRSGRCRSWRPQPDARSAVRVQDPSIAAAEPVQARSGLPDLVSSHGCDALEDEAVVWCIVRSHKYSHRQSCEIVDQQPMLQLHVSGTATA